MKLIIDRFEGDFAICEKENREMINIDKDKIPSGAKEGHVLVLINNRIEIDEEETKKRINEIEKTTEDLWD